MRDTWVIARREFTERVRSKWFIAMTLISPLLMIALIVIPAVLGGRGTAGAKVAIVDHTTDHVAETLTYRLSVVLKWEVSTVPPTTTEQALRARIRSHDINGFVVVPEDALDGGEIVYSGDNASNQTVSIGFTQIAQQVVLSTRAKRAGIDEVQLAMIMKPVSVSVRHTTGEEQGASGIFTFLLGYMLAMITYTMITLYGQSVMRSVITEKSSRIVELLVAATKPNAMMSGKIIGVGLAGLAQIAIWVVVGGVLLHFRDDLLHLVGAHPSPSLIPSLTAAQIGVVLACFVLGYLFYSAMYAAVGAMVSSEQDSQQAQLPVTFLLLIGMGAIVAVANDPRGDAANVLTMVPFWSPMLMPMRYFLGGATAAQLGISLSILLVSTVVVARAAAKIYRVGILMYGKRPSPRELVRWLRH